MAWALAESGTTLQGVSSKAITDHYLLDLAVSNKGKLATLDTKIDPAPVVGGTQALEIIR